MEALFLHLTYVDDSRYYFDYGSDNNKQKNYGNYEDGDDFFSFLHAKIMKQQSDPNGAPCPTSMIVWLIYDD